MKFSECSASWLTNSSKEERIPQLVSISNQATLSQFAQLIYRACRKVQRSPLCWATWQLYLSANTRTSAADKAEEMGTRWTRHLLRFFSVLLRLLRLRQANRRTRKMYVLKLNRFHKTSRYHKTVSMSKSGEKEATKICKLKFIAFAHNERKIRLIIKWRIQLIAKLNENLFVCVPS